MRKIKELRQSLLISVWFMFLTFPIMVIRVNTIDNIIEWRWMNMIYVGLGSFVFSFIWRYLLSKKQSGAKLLKADKPAYLLPMQRIFANPWMQMSALFFIAVFAVIFPFVFSSYQINIMTTALMYVVLGLGLNIVVGQAGLLNLGYAAFYAVGAYSYALLNYHFGIGFWTALPIGAALAALFGIILGLPVLRLRGDYLAIVTLGFGEIVRLVLENWNEFSFGPSGISNIPRPGFFGIELNFEQVSAYLYFLVIGICLLAIFVIRRLQNSRIGRAWIAMREDEVACQSMGIDMTRAKLTALALSSMWAGLVGVIFAAKTTFINPASFTFLESAMILSIIVIGGMGTILGVIVGAFLLILLPEYLRALSDYRMLAFGAAIVLMMIFRPQGIVTVSRRTYQFSDENHAPDISTK